MQKDKIYGGRSIMGAVGSGATGAWGGDAVAAETCIGIAALTAPVGGSGRLVCGVVVEVGTGIGAWIGGEAGGAAGESIGETIYEASRP